MDGSGVVFVVGVSFWLLGFWQCRLLVPVAGAASTEKAEGGMDGGWGRGVWWGAGGRVDGCMGVWCQVREIAMAYRYLSWVKGRMDG